MKHYKTRYLENGIGVALGLLIALWGYSEALMVFIPVGVAIVGYNVYRIVRLRRQSDAREDPAYREQDEERSDKLLGMKRRIGLLKWGFRIAVSVAVIAWIVAMVSEVYVPAVLVSVVAVVLWVMTDRCRETQKAYVSDEIVRGALEEVFEVQQYHPFGCIARERLYGSHFGISDFDGCEGSDYMEGFYQGLPIEMCDMILTTRDTRFKEDGRAEEFDTQVFQGFWLICDFDRELTTDVRIWKRSGLDKWLGSGSIQTENEHFNKQFWVASEDERAARSFLSPSMMDCILEIDRTAQGKIHVRFERSGRVQIAVRREHDSFEVEKHGMDATMLRKKFAEEIHYITDLIDVLRLGNSLYHTDL